MPEHVGNAEKRAREPEPGAHLLELESRFTHRGNYIFIFTCACARGGLAESLLLLLSNDCRTLA